MDFLKAEINSKKRQLDQLAQLSSTTSSSSADPAAPPPAKKYLKRSELDQLKQREEQEREAERERQRREKLYGMARKVAKREEEEGKSLLPGSSASRTASASPRDGSAPPSESAVDSSKPEAFNISNDEAIRRLRAKGQPIRLFAESDKDRRLRLRALELIEERTEGQRNDFMRAMEGQELGLELEEVARRVNGGKGEGAKEQDKGKGKGKEDAGIRAKEREDGDDGPKEPKPKDEEVLVDLGLVKTNPHKVYPQIYHALKRVLKEWEQSLADRPESVKRSTQGKVAAATQATSAEYLKPLFKSLRKRDLAPDVLLAVAEITFYMQTREYLRANDSYLRLSIGNAPWPIGVTMVGIHERSGREKIFSNNVAHVLNDETSRKYIQSLKRLLTFAQAVRPPADVSQKMG